MLRIHDAHYASWRLQPVILKENCAESFSSVRELVVTPSGGLEGFVFEMEKVVGPPAGKVISFSVHLFLECEGFSVAPCQPSARRAMGALAMRPRLWRTMSRTHPWNLLEKSPLGFLERFLNMQQFSKMFEDNSLPELSWGMSCHEVPSNRATCWRWRSVLEVQISWRGLQWYQQINLCRNHVSRSLYRFVDFCGCQERLLDFAKWIDDFAPANPLTGT